MTETTAPARAGLSLPGVIAFCLPALATGAYAVAVTVYLPVYLAGHIGITAGMVGNIFLIVRLIDFVFDPVIGVVMDHTKSRYGRYRLWMMLGAPIFALAVYMVFMVKQGVSAPFVIFWVLMIYVGNSILNLSHTAWASLLAPTYDDRSRLYGWMSAVGVVGAGALLAFSPVMGINNFADPRLLHAMGWFMVVAALVSVAIAAPVTKEARLVESPPQVSLTEYWNLLKRPEVARLIFADLCLALGPGWMAALYLLFFRDSRGFDATGSSILLLIYTLAGLFGAVGLSRLAVIYGKHRTLIAASTGYSLGLILLFVMPKSNFLIDGPFMFAMGFLATGFTLLVRAMVADVGDQVRLETGQQRVGLLFALIVSTQKLAGAMSIFLAFHVLDLVGYQPKLAVNTPAAIHGLELTYLLGPIFFVMLGGACFIGYKLDSRKHADIRAALELRDASSTEAPVIETLVGH